MSLSYFSSQLYEDKDSLGKKELVFKVLVFVAILILTTGCAQSGYKKFYQSYTDTNNSKFFELLEKGQEPELLQSNNLDRDVRILLSKNYEPIGYSSFNGIYEEHQNALSQAKRVGASVVLISSGYTHTQTQSSALLIPNNKTTYFSGTFNSNTSYATGGFSGTANSYGSSVVPYSKQYDLYDQHAVFLAKSTRKYRFGLRYGDLEPDERSRLKRNTGAIVWVVIEDSPAFYANVLAGDVIIAIDEKEVRSSNEAMRLMNEVPLTNKSATLKVLREGRNENIKVVF